jgi:hypothetical protein
VKQREQFVRLEPQAVDDLCEQMAELKKLREQVRQAEANRTKQFAIDHPERRV